MMSRRRAVPVAALAIVVALFAPAGSGVKGQEGAPAETAPAETAPETPPPAAPPSAPAAHTLVVQTGYRVMTPAIRLLDVARQEAVYAMGYTEADATAPGWRLGDDAGIVSARALERSGGGRARIEMGLYREPSGLVSVRLLGDEDGRPNPELPLLAEFIRRNSVGTDAAPGINPHDLGVYPLTLSYTGTDRAISSLKSLGYTTVEHSSAEGESPYDKIYTIKEEGGGHLPIIVKMIDSPKTSLLDKAPVDPFKQGKVENTSPFGYGSDSAVPDIGGLYLHHPTTSDPLQRLLILYDPYDEESLDRLLQIIRETIDVPARQIVIEALVLEVRVDDLTFLGSAYRTSAGRLGFEFPVLDAAGENVAGSVGSLAGAFYDTALDVDPELFRATFAALIRDGRAEVLSNPSVLVLDNRHARVQIGQQRPVTRKFVRDEGTDFDVVYFPVGIVLNIRAHVSEDEKHVAMQVETIVSAVDQRSEQEQDIGTALSAPIVDTRQIQSFVRVADNTPFIIGGLIQKTESVRRDRIPILGYIPVIGPILFGSTDSIMEDREVIVVLIPHIVPASERDFSYLIPRDSDSFNISGASLFRNTYRLRAKDVFDLTFVTQSDALKHLRRRVRTAAADHPGLLRDPGVSAVLHNRIPGEEVSVWKMLYEVVEELKLEKDLDRDRVLYFIDDPAAPDGQGYKVSFLHQQIGFLDPKAFEKSRKIPGTPTGIILTYPDQAWHGPDDPFDRPTARITLLHEPIEDYDRLLQEWNKPDPVTGRSRFSIVLTSPADVTKLYVCLLLKEIIDLNEESGLELPTFKVGRQLILPSGTSGAKRFHVIDRRVAEYFYKVRYYYSVFEDEFVRQSREILARVEAYTSDPPLNEPSKFDKPGTEVEPLPESPVAID